MMLYEASKCYGQRLLHAYSREQHDEESLVHMRAHDEVLRFGLRERVDFNAHCSDLILLVCISAAPLFKERTVRASTERSHFAGAREEKRIDINRVTSPTR